MDIEYRQATEADLQRLAEMRWEFDQEEGRAPLLSRSEFIVQCSEFMRRGLRSGSWTYWVAVSGEILSHIFVEKVPKLPRPSAPPGAWGYVTNVHTLPEWRNRGVGSELLRRVVQWAEAERLELLIVWPSERSVGFYECAGFRTENEVLELLLEEE